MNVVGNCCITLFSPAFLDSLVRDSMTLSKPTLTASLGLAYKLKHMCVKPNFFAAENQRAKKTLIVGEREERKEEMMR